jgi:hypothetical protein
MGFLSRGGRLWLSTGIAAGVCLLSPLAAQQLAPRLLPAPFPQTPAGDQQPVDSQVLLGVDGSFTVAVVAADGSLVSGARVTLTTPARAPASSLTCKTKANGMVVISGIKPGLYQVAIEAAQASYQGMLLVRPADPGDKTGPHLVAFTLESGCSPEMLERLVCAPGVGAGLLTGHLADPLLIGAAAVATALSLTVGEEEGPAAPVASP